MFDKEDSESYENYYQKLNADLGRFEKMIRAREHYYFDADALSGMIEYHQSNNQLNKAEEVLRFALKLHPHDFYIQLKQAEFHFLTGNSAEAINLLNELEKKHPGEIDLFILKGNIYLETEQYELAAEYFELAADYADFPEEIYVNLAFAYRQLNEIARAEACIMKAFELCDEGVDASEEFVDFYTSTNQVERGIHKAEELIDEDPYHSVVWYALGCLYLRIRNYEKAIEALEYSLVIDDDFVNARIQLAAAYFGARQYEKAIELHKSTLRFSVFENLTYFCIGDCYFHLGQMGEARFYYRKSVKSNPDFPDAYYGIALTYLDQKRWNEANHYIRKAIDLDSNVANYFYTAGVCELNIFCIEAATKNFLQAVELDRTLLKAWYALLDCLISSGEYAGALGNCIDAIIANESDPELHYRLACYLFMNSRNKEAYAVFEKALHLDRKGYPIAFSIYPQLHQDRQLNELIAHFGME